MNKTKKIIIIILSCVVVLGGIYAALRILKQKNQNSKTAGVYAVSEIGYDASSMWDNSTLSGNVTVNSEQKVYVGKTQAVSEIKVKEGQTVKAGDVLLVYDTTANDLQLDLQKMQETLGDEYVVVLRTHYFIVNVLDLSAYEGFVYNASTYNDIAHLYLIADVMITDYSSVFFDYANLKRPILFFMYDIEKYRDALRGFYFDIEKELPGPILKTSDEVIASIQNLSRMEEQYKSKYEMFYDKYCGWENGTSAKQVVQAVFQK